MKVLALLVVLLAHTLAAAATDDEPYAATYSKFKVKPHQVALILLHGKWGAPPAPLATEFKEQRFHVISPSMPWARDRYYDVSYETGLKVLNEIVKAARADGYQRVIMGGQSFGANGALAYASAYGDIDGLILFAPGHNPDIDRNYQPRLVSIAKEAINSGKPETPISFTDYNDGSRTQTFEARADVFVSFFGEDSLANMSLSARRIKTPIPTIVFMGNGDYVTRQGSHYFFDRLPKHPLSRYTVSSASHRGVPKASFEETLAWIKEVIRQ
jgi:pimeloyl-ACP methyl ester carboxylesterase